MPRRFKTSFYKINNAKFNKNLRFAVVADLHTDIPDGLYETLKNLSPDAILMPGDTFERLDGSKKEKNDRSYAFLEKASEIAPVFFSVGNHENGGIASWNSFKWHLIDSIPKYYSPEDLDKIAELEKKSVFFLDDEYTVHNEIAIGGLSSGLINEGHIPNLDWLDRFTSLDTQKILLCHHPEYYRKHLKDKKIDLIVSGHAHGGQWRIFLVRVRIHHCRIFSKYTSGIHDSRFVISRGLKGSGKIPRIFNTPELVIIDITAK